MEDDTPSARLLRWLKDPAHPKRSGAHLGRILGVSQAAASAWAHGKSRPDVELRGPLEELTGIPASAWYTPDELARIERVRAAVEHERTLPTAVGQ